MAGRLARSALLLGSFLSLQKPGFSGYEAINPPNSVINYNLNDMLASVRTFPDEANIAREDYRYFFNELNFNFNSRLLTGAADELYLFDLDLNVLSNYTWEPDRSVVASCNQTNDNSTYTCRNHIRIFKQLPSIGNQILVCGTQADTTPQCRIVELNGNVFGRGFTASPASNGLLSYYPEYTSFGEFLAASGSDERFFSAALGSTDRDFRISFSNVTLSNPANPNTLQTAELFKTLNLDRWLDFPVTFVDYFRADYQPVAPATIPEHYQFYFVFLRESLTNADNDPGLTSSMPGFGNQFTTFMKARIFCEREVPPGRQFAGTVDFQYNEIKSMVFNEEGRYAQTTNWVKLMYGAFTGPSIGPVGTAICVYRAYNGRETGESGFNRGIFDIFREDLQNAQGGEVESTYVECEPGGRSESDSELIQVVQDVSQIGENPLLVLDGLIVTQMAVDQVCVVRSDGTSCVNQDILFLGTDTGKILKVIFVSTGLAADPIAPVIAEEISLDDDNAVNQLSMRQADDGVKYIYASTFSKIYRLPLQRCGRHNKPNNVTDSCRSCISSRDPYCVWNMTHRMCEPNPLVVQTSSTNTAIGNYLQNIHTNVIPSDCTFPEIGFTIPSDSVSESEASYTVTVRSTVAGAASNGLVNIYTLQGGNATAGMDYVAASGDPITFAPGSTETTYTITLLPDNTFEGGNEQLIVGLQAVDVPGAEPVVISQSRFTLNIVEDDTVTVRLDSAEISVSEGASFVNVNITRTGSTTVDTRVILNTVLNGTAVAGEDYFPVQTEVIFSPSESMRTVTIPLINNNVQEPREWLLVELVLPADQVGTFLGVPAVSNITILDDDLVEFGFEATSYSISESVGVVEVGVVKYGSSSLSLSVSLSTKSGSATSPQDFTSISGQELTFSPAQNRQTVNINVINDGIFEDSEEFTVLLMPVSQVLLDGSNTTTVQISDDDTLIVGFSPTQYTVSEGDRAVLLNVSVNRQFEAESVVLQASLFDGTATTGADFNYLIPSTLEFRSGGDTSTQVTVTIVDDNTVESLQEEFSVQISSINPRVIVQDNMADITITDDDVVEFGFEAAGYSTSESGSVVMVGVIKYGSSSLPLSVSLSTMSGSAISPQDFTSINGQELIFSPAQSRQTANINIINDGIFEDSEDFTILLMPVSAQSRVLLDGSNTTTVQISDDDMLIVGFSPTQYTVSEGDRAVLLNVSVNGQFEAESVVLLVNLENGTTISGALIPNTLIFRSGDDTLKQVIVAITDDNTVESSQEQFSVQISSTNPRVIVQDNMADITVIDDDVVEFGFEAAGYSISESGGVVEVDVVKYGSSSLPLSVSLSTMSGSATSPQDFTSINGQELIFSPAQSRQTANINIINDGIFEDSENFTILLMPVSAQSRVLLDGSNETIVQISDDDTLSVRFSPTLYTVSEGDGAVLLNVSVNGQFEAESVVLQASLMDGTATRGVDQDFNFLIPNTLEFRSGGDTSTQVTVTIVDDNIVESLQEQFSVQISSTNPRVIVQQDMADITITDDDVVEFGFEAAGYSISESGGVVVVGVVKYGSSSLPLSVSLSTMSSSATSPQDFAPINSQELTFSPAQSRQTMNINIADDAVLENIEQFSVMLAVSQNDRQARVMDVLNSSTITISDNDRGSVNLSSTEYMITEGAGVISVGVIFGALQSQVVVGLSTIPGTASEETDFTSQMVLLTASSSSSQTVMVQLLDDDILEDRENFTIQLFSTDSRVDLQQSTATVWIMDDDSVSVGFGSPAYTASETDCFISVNIRLLSGSTGIPLYFNLTTTSGVALAGQDFVSVSRMPVTLDPGSAASEVNVQLLDDDLVEKDPESFMLLLEPREDLPQRVVIDSNTATIYIEDDDSFTTQQTAETSAPPGTTTSAGVVNEQTTKNIIVVGPGGSLRDQCIYDSFNTSVAVLAALLAIIVLLLLLLLISCCVLIKKVKEGRFLKKYDPDFSSVSGSKRTSPDRFPMDNFGVPNKIYRENSNSEPNTPAVKRMENEFGDTPPEVILNSNNNGNVEGIWQPGLEDSSGSSEDLTMTKL